MPTDRGQKAQKSNSGPKRMKDFAVGRKKVAFRVKTPKPVDAALVEVNPALAAKRLFAEENRAVVKALREGTSLARFKPEEQKPNPYLPFPTEFYATEEGRAILGAARLANERLDGFIAAGEEAAKTRVARAESAYASAKSAFNVALANGWNSAGTSSEQQQREASETYSAAQRAMELAAAQLGQAQEAAKVWPGIRSVALQTFSATATPVLTKTLSRFSRWAEVAKEFRYEVGILPTDVAVEPDIRDLRARLVLAVDGLEIRPVDGRELIAQLDTKLSVIRAPPADGTSDDDLLIEAEGMDLDDLLDAIEQAKTVNQLLAARLQAVYNRRSGGNNPDKTGSDDKLLGLPKPVAYGAGILALILIFRKRGA
jgi:hypothetical protein